MCPRGPRSPRWLKPVALSACDDCAAQHSSFTNWTASTATTRHRIPIHESRLQSASARRWETVGERVVRRFHEAIPASHSPASSPPQPPHPPHANCLGYTAAMAPQLVLPPLLRLTHYPPAFASHIVHSTISKSSCPAPPLRTRTTHRRVLPTTGGCHCAIARCSTAD